MTIKATWPGVGDLVVHGHSKYVVSDIVGLRTDDPRWEMRLIHGGTSPTVVRKDTIEGWEIEARCGQWQRM